MSPPLLSPSTEGAHHIARKNTFVARFDFLLPPRANKVKGGAKRRRGKGKPEEGGEGEAEEVREVTVAFTMTDNGEFASNKCLMIELKTKSRNTNNTTPISSLPCNSQCQPRPPNPTLGELKVGVLTRAQAAKARADGKLVDRNGEDEGEGADVQSRSVEVEEAGPGSTHGG